MEIVTVEYKDLMADLLLPKFDYVKIVKDAMDQMLRDILTKLLGRPAELEDAKRLTIKYDSRELNPLNYEILFDGHPIGKITVKFPIMEDGFRGTVTFEPINL